jgi:protease I
MRVILMGKNALIVIPKNQFCEEELYGITFALESQGVCVVVLSESGKEAHGMKLDKFKPDGMIVDWDRQPEVQGKYNAVILVGGKGAKKSLWNDPIIPQILTDHHRSGSVIGATGSAMVVLVKALLVAGEMPLPIDSDAQKELKLLNAICIDAPVTRMDNIILGRGADSVNDFSQQILHMIDNEQC